MQHCCSYATPIAAPFQPYPSLSGLFHGQSRTLADPSRSGPQALTCRCAAAPLFRSLGRPAADAKGRVAGGVFTGPLGPPRFRTIHQNTPENRQKRAQEPLSGRNARGGHSITLGESDLLRNGTTDPSGRQEGASWAGAHVRIAENPLRPVPEAFFRPNAGGVHAYPSETALCPESPLECPKLSNKRHS